jgi:hypothetical protein
MSAVGGAQRDGRMASRRVPAHPFGSAGTEAR